MGVAPGEEPGSCSVDVTCEDGPEQSVECDGVTCTCYVDGQQIGSCEDTQAVCDNPGQQSLIDCCE